MTRRARLTRPSRRVRSWDGLRDSWIRGRAQDLRDSAQRSVDSARLSAHRSSQRCVIGARRHPDQQAMTRSFPQGQRTDQCLAELATPWFTRARRRFLAWSNSKHVCDADPRRRLAALAGAANRVNAASTERSTRPGQPHDRGGSDDPQKCAPHCNHKHPKALPKPRPLQGERHDFDVRDGIAAETRLFILGYYLSAPDPSSVRQLREGRRPGVACGLGVVSGQHQQPRHRRR